jgi:Tfp pilus assembly protein PilF
MICPILTQARRDNDGNTSFEHHECIEGACSFWADEVRSCSLRASGLLIIARARAALATGAEGEAAGPAQPGEPLFGSPRAVIDPDTLAPLLAGIERVQHNARETGLKLLEGVAALEEPLKATGHELGSRLDMLNATLLSATTGMEGRLGHLEQGLQEVRHAVVDGTIAKPAFVGDLEESLASLTRRLGALGDRFAGLSDHLEAVSTEVSRLGSAHEEISAALSRESERRQQDEARRLRDEARALNTRGVALFHKGSPEAAEAAFRQASEMDPVFAEAHNNLGLALSRLGREEEAREAFTRALELDPGMAEAINNLGFLFHRGMEFEKAVEMFRRAADTAQDASVAYTNLGNACYGLARYGDAVDAWKKAIEQDPHNEQARRALQMFQQGEPRPN